MGSNPTQPIKDMKMFDAYTKEQWKEVARNLLYTLNNGDGEMAEYMCEKYTPYLLPDEENEEENVDV